jgi:hypothetical protein
MREIELTRGYVATVDDEDYERVSKYLWYAEVRGNSVYARCRRGPGLMHVFIMGKRPGFDIDHADGDTLNNTRANLRHCTRSQNAANRFCSDSGNLLCGSVCRRRSSL